MDLRFLKAASISLKTNVRSTLILNVNWCVLNLALIDRVVVSWSATGKGDLERNHLTSPMLAIGTITRIIRTR